MGSRLYDVQCIIKNRQKLYSFTANYDQPFQSNTSSTDLRKCMALKLFKHINPI